MKNHEDGIKKNVLIIYPQLDVPYSGGEVIDFEFIRLLEKSENLNCNYLLDSTFRDNSIMGYNHYALLHIRKIAKYDIIFTNSRLYPRLLLCFCMLKLFRCKSKIVVYHHHFNYQTQRGLLWLIHKFFELSFLKLMDTVIIPSPFVRDEMKKLLPRVDIAYIEIGFDLIFFYDKNKIKRNNLLFVGTVEARKQVLHLVAVADYLRKNGVCFHINIVGSLSETAYVNNLIKKISEWDLNDCITLKGRLSASELNEEYKNADVFLFPSSHEGYGMVLLEAMSYGLPVIAYRNSAMPFSVKNGLNGVLVNNNDSSDFSKQLYAVLTNEALWKSLCYNAYESAMQVPTLLNMKEKMMQYINKL